MQFTAEQASSLYGQDVQDQAGNKIGSIRQVWATAGQPAWVSVETDGPREPMAPLGNAQMQQGKLKVAYDKATVQSAPSVEPGNDKPLNAEPTAQLYEHYRTEPKQTPQAREELIRFEERLRVGTERQTTGKAVLRKKMVTEDVHTTVPITHDEVYIEREPITAGEAGGIRAEMGEAEQEMALHAERPVVSKERVPVERVHLAKNEVVEDQPIDEQVRHEEIEADIPESGRRRR